jgi:hypothetical protein
MKIDRPRDALKTRRRIAPPTHPTRRLDPARQIPDAAIGAVLDAAVWFPDYPPPQTPP